MVLKEKILIADDEENIRWVLKKGLEKEGYSVLTVDSAIKAIEKLKKEYFDVIFMDIRMPQMNGLEALGKLKEINPDALIIIITAYGSMKTAIEAMQKGAYDYLTKPFDMEEVKLITRRALNTKALSREVTHLREGIMDVLEFGTIVGNSPRMQEVYKAIGKTANTDVTVLLRGESGTGKELVARAIHHHSRRVGKPFVTVNCAAIPSTLLESELFGYEKGAFTDAHQRRFGKFELATEGTIFLDEIGDMTLDLQTKILRILQEKEFERVGGSETIKVNVRVIAATNKNLEEEMQKGSFREDLYYRLNVVSIYLPPLRERREDIPALIDYFIAKYSKDLGVKYISSEALDLLVRYNWPGNVRELENIVQRAMVMTTTNTILPENIPLTISPSEMEPVRFDGTSLEKMVEKKLSECIKNFRGLERGNLHSLVVSLVEKPMIEVVLKEMKYNQIKAANLLGINRNTLRKKIKELGISLEKE